jgi:ketosteroid isomerase-like protein
MSFLLLPVLLTAQRNYPVPQPSEQPAQSLPRHKEEPSPEGRNQQEQQIKAALLSQVEAWNRGKLEDYMEGYWHSPDLTFFSGASVTRGWEPTLERYRQRYKASGREMGQLEFQNLAIDVLGANSAVVTGKWQLTMSDGKQPHGLFTLIVKRLPVGWRIVHDHTSAE